MKNSSWLKRNADLIGFYSSMVCMVHCIVLPVVITMSLFSVNGFGAHWHTLDYLFIVLSFLAVLYATKRSPTQSMRIGLWFSFAIFSFALMAHEAAPWMLFISLAASIALMVLHIVNYRVCSIPKPNS
ncbi:MerC domain-containing protein [Fulvivirgaceae bacterium LMO-SS25]